MRPAVLLARVRTQLRLKQALDALRQQATLDQLTRCANRHVLIDWFHVGNEASDPQVGIFGKPSEYGDRHGRDHSSRFFAAEEV